MSWGFASRRQVVVSLKNAARNASAKVARYAVRKHIERPPQEAFKASWASLISNPVYRVLVRISQDPAWGGTQLKGRTFELLSLAIPEFYHSTRIAVSANLKVAIGSEKSFIIAHIHEGHSFVSRVLAEHKREFTRIVGNPERYARRMRGQGIDTSRANLIKKGLLSLAHLRKSIRSNHVICSVLDYGEGEYISPAIFIFANRVQIPVFFVKAHVNDDGVGELISSGPHNNVDPEICANKFLNFYNSVGESRVDMKIIRPRLRRK